MPKKKAKHRTFVNSYRDLTCPCGMRFVQHSTLDNTRYRLHMQKCEKARTAKITHELVRHTRNVNITDAYESDAAALDALQFSKRKSVKNYRRLNRELAEKRIMGAGMDLELSEKELSEIRSISQKIRK